MLRYVYKSVLLLSFSVLILCVIYPGIKSVVDRAVQPVMVSYSIAGMAVGLTIAGRPYVFNYEYLTIIGEASPETFDEASSLLDRNDSQGAYLANQVFGPLRNLGNFAEAEQLLREALSLDERIFGPDHPNVA